MKAKLISLLLGGALAVSLLSGCGSPAAQEPAQEAAESDVPVSEQTEIDESGETLIEFSDGVVTANGVTAALDNGELILDEGGVYRLTGSGEARVVVDAADSEEFTIILDGCDFTCADDEVIYFKTARAAELVLAEGSVNVLTSGDISNAEEPADEEASGAALRFKCPLTVTGSGSLSVGGYINNGIGGSGDLVIDGGVITVASVNDGVKSKSNITVNDGVLTVTSQGDGIQAEGELSVNGGTVDIHTGAGALDADMKVSDSSMMGMGGGPGRGSREASGETNADDETAAEVEIPEDTEGDQTERASDEMGGAFSMPWDMDDETSVSRKGLKAATAINITGGSVALDCADDAIHSDGDVTVSGGELRIASGDDGVHADSILSILGGTVDVVYCYEGLEAKSILIGDGFVSVVATDDGMNVNGGDGMFFGPSAEASSEAEEEDDTEDIPAELRIKGGVVLVDSGGDGLDSNGSIYIEGGEVFVSGPSSNWDAAIDYGEGSSEFVVTGGSIMAGGYSGMAEAPDDTDGAQPAIYYVLSDYAEDGDLCTLTDANGTVLLSFQFVHGYNCVVLSSPELTVGETYTLTAGDETAEIELTGTVFSNRTRGGMGGFPGMPGGASGESSQG